MARRLPVYAGEDRAACKGGGGVDIPFLMLVLLLLAVGLCVLYSASSAQSMYDSGYRTSLIYFRKQALCGTIGLVAMHGVAGDSLDIEIAAPPLGQTAAPARSQAAAFGELSAMVMPDGSPIAVPAAQTGNIWNKKDLPGLPDLTLAANSPALESGVDISKPFTVNGKKFPAFPGFAPGYFKGKAPAAGALQQGESQQRFIQMHNKAEAAVRMINQLKESK
jgi:hypothetical protein